MGATWPEWGRRALLDALPIETCSVTYQQALQSPAHSMFKCCVTTASALPFIFVSLLPNNAGSCGGVGASRRLVREHICQRADGSVREVSAGLADEKPVLRFTEPGSHRLGWAARIFKPAVFFFVGWGLVFAKGQKMLLHRSHSGGGPWRVFILKGWFWRSSKGTVSWPCFWFFSRTL